MEITARLINEAIKTIDENIENVNQPNDLRVLGAVLILLVDKVKDKIFDLEEEPEK